MHRSFMVPVVCLAIFAGGCAVDAVDADDPEPTEKQPPAYEANPDSVETSMRLERPEPATDSWDLADLIQIAEAAVAKKNLKAAVLPGILRHSLASAPTPCVTPECLSHEPRRPVPGHAN